MHVSRQIPFRVPYNTDVEFSVTVQILRHRRTQMSFHFPRATFWVLSTRQASGGKQEQRMAFVVVCRALSSILMHVAQTIV
jgi:hypothetical protein